MRGKSFLSLGGISMGIAGSLVDQSLFEVCLGMRVEAVDMTEFVRRINREIFEPVRITGRFISSIKVITHAIGDLPIIAEQLRIKVEGSVFNHLKESGYGYSKNESWYFDLFGRA